MSLTISPSAKIHKFCKRRTRGIRLLEHRTYNLLMDRLDEINGDRPSLVPPRAINYNSPFFRSREAYVRAFVESGNDIVEMLKQYGGLQPNHRVLDIGCGIGRVAAALTNYLDGGAYDGFDTITPTIEWCRRAYERQPSFRFHYVDVSYGRIKQGALDPRAVRFPFDDGSFDFAFSISLFTHMQPPALQNYLSEIRRVLKPGGTTVNTFFLLDDFAHEAMARRETRKRFFFRGEGFYAKNSKDIENGVAYDEDACRQRHLANGFTVVDPIRFGSWTGRETNRYLYQDVVVARKREVD